MLYTCRLHRISSDLQSTATLLVLDCLPFKGHFFAQDEMFNSYKGHFFAQDDMFGKSSIGIGFRKSCQGIPLKFDVTLTKDGKVGTFASLGRDWTF